MKPTLRECGKRRRGATAAALLASAALAGCATVEVPTTVDAPGMPNAELALQKSMREVDAEMGRIGRMQPRAGAEAMPAVVPGELDRVVVFEWNGPLDGAVEALAKTIGYRTAFRAPPDAQPLTIAIDSAPRRVYDLLVELGEDAGSQATVSVDPHHQMIEVIHHV